ncbi:MFS transporter [Janibacter cremeus]|uniref:MFS family permease n=1 Tax=Janibacter cremeus TaxID=1285192 RepID=A0A852VL86_9MICO|nr:MFS transporter [Janibacter cremeus]NYF97837.1 MFS family permease [Janibacter cremeus]
MSPTFASLSVRNYRVYATGGIVSNTGTWMGRTAQDWVVLTMLTDHSATALGIVTGLQFLPMLALAPWAGSVIDRVPKRALLMVSQAMLGLAALVGGVLVVTGTAQLWHFYLIALATGLATAFDNPARQSFVSEMVPMNRLANAVALNSASFNLGRLAGPGVAGLVIAAFGSGPALLLNAASFGAVIFALTLMRTSELSPAPRATGRGGVREGLRYVRGRPDIQLVLLLVFVLGTFGLNFQMTIALMATEVFDRDAQGYGLLGTILAIGSLSAALYSARRNQPRLRVLLISLTGFTIAATAAALAPTYWTFAIALAACGGTALSATTTANAMVQMRCDPSMRGRVMALYMALFVGGKPLGAPIIGVVGDVLGPRWTVGVGAIAVGITLAAVARWMIRHENVRVSYSYSQRPHLRVTRPAPEAQAEVAAR